MSASSIGAAPVAPTGSDVSAWSNYTVEEEQYNEVLTMFTQANQDSIQTVGSITNSVAQTATSIAQESMGTSIAASTARAKDVDSESQEVTQA
jgi:hemoglobin-like flavoprotein